MLGPPTCWPRSGLVGLTMKKRPDRAEAEQAEALIKTRESPGTALGTQHQSSSGSGKMIDHFKIMRLLGQGGMGEVFLARDTKLGRKVALKLLRPRLAASGKALERLLFEARATARFNHPHIVTIHAVGEHEGRPYLALEYLEGQNLRERAAERRLSLREILRVVLAIAEALAEAHRHGILHRDLKPANVVIPRDGRVRVVDFGIAQKHGGEPELELAAGEPATKSPGESEPPPSAVLGAAPSGRAGTPAYMAPEQWMGVGCTPATDIWAWGIIVFELCASCSPFGDTVFSDDESADTDLDSENGASAKIPSASQKAQSKPSQGDESMTADAPIKTVVPDAIPSAKERMLKRMVRVCGPKPAPPLEALADVPQVLADLVAACLNKTATERPAAAEIVDQLTQMLDLPRRSLTGEDSPFRGLLPFTRHHADLFFGREAEIVAFVERVRWCPVLPVVGPSGAGKSSFVQAGVVPRLREQGRWTVVQLRPGSRPFRSLAQSLLRSHTTEGSSELDSSEQPTSAQLEGTELGGLVKRLEADPGLLALKLRRIAEELQANVILFVDQLEELFTLTGSGDEALRNSFVRALYAAADDAHDPVRVMFTIRGDFLDRLAEASTSREGLPNVTVLQRPDAESLEEILTRPLQAVGYRYEDPDLVREMVASVGAEPACLPLLQFAAQMLWDHRDKAGKLLLRSAYEQMGGVEGALAKHADGVLEGLSATELRLARELLLRLVTPEKTRRVLLRGRALEGLGKAEAVLRRLTDARLITVTHVKGEPASNAMLELAHESLILTWTTLADWLDASQDELVFLAEAGQAAELWDKRGRRPDELWEGPALSEAMPRLEACSTQVPELVQQFLASGEQHRARQATRRRASIMIAIAVLVAIAGVLGVQKREADRQRKEADQMRAAAENERNEAQRRRAEALLEGARAALDAGRVLQARAKLRAALEIKDGATARALWAQLSTRSLVWSRRLGALLYDVAQSPDGRWVAVACQDGASYLLDVDTGEPRILRGGDQTLTLAFSADAKLLATGSWNGQVRLWNAQSGRELRLFEGHTDAAKSVAFSPDGKMLASASHDRSVRLWDVAGKKHRELKTGHKGYVMSVAISSDGQHIASASVDGSVRLFDAASGKRKRVFKGHRGAVLTVTFSPDSRTVASAGQDRRIRFWDVDTGRQKRALKGHEGTIWKLAYSTDGLHMVSGSVDKSARLWDLKSGQARLIGAHRHELRGISIGQNGQRVATAAGRTVRLWNAARRPPSDEDRGHPGPVNGVSFTRDGKLLVSGGHDGSVHTWDVSTGAQQQTFHEGTVAVGDVPIAPDGKRVAAAGADSNVLILNLVTGKRERVLSGHKSSPWTLSFSPDGKRLASGGLGRSVRLWDLATGSQEHKLDGHSAQVRSVRFSPDGALLVSAGQDTTIRVWDAESGKSEKVLREHAARIDDLAFNADGTQLASASMDKSVRIFDTEKWTSRPLKHPARVYSVMFHPDQQRLATASADGKARIWDLTNDNHQVLGGHRAEVNAVAFSMDGKLLATASDDATVRLWDVATARPHWRAPLLLRDGPKLLSHRGWQALGGDKAEPPATWAPKALARLTGQGRYAVQNADGKRLCVQTYDSKLELWDLTKDKRLASKSIEGLEQVVAVADGCAGRAGKNLYIVQGGDDIKKVAMDTAPTALGGGAQLLVAAGGKVIIFTASGERKADYDVSPGVTALVLDHRSEDNSDWVIVMGTSS